MSSKDLLSPFILRKLHNLLLLCDSCMLFLTNVFVKKKKILFLLFLKLMFLLMLLCLLLKSETVIVSCIIVRFRWDLIATAPKVLAGKPCLVIGYPVTPFHHNKQTRCSRGCSTITSVIH